MVPSHVNDRERAYSSAIALRDWFREHKTPVSSINVLREGAHARRTRLLYQKAFDQNVTVGIIASPTRIIIRNNGGVTAMVSAKS